MLSVNERLLLKTLKQVKEGDAEFLMKLTGLNKDGVLRGLYFLSEKGLVELKKHVEEGYRRTEEGERALRNMPELTLLKKDRNIKELDKELLPLLGPLKKYRFVKVENSMIKVINKNIEEYPLYKALKELKGEGLDVLEKRGYLEHYKGIKYYAKITRKGLSFDDKEGIKHINREVIESGEWKKGFAELNIKHEDVKPYATGKLHVLTRMMRKIKQIFLSLGFEEMEGNYVEESFWNFDALFQPQDHPSRELADTFYVKGSRLSADSSVVERVKAVHEQYWKYKWSFDEAKQLVLRTHTTVLSARTLYKKKRGKFFAIGRVFRNEAIDYKHLAEFHQVEGIVAWREANFRNLLWLLKEFYKKLGFERVRFRPSYFPYTEPSLEIEVWFEPKQEWVELGGAGIFRKEVAEPLGSEWPVLAWGLSLERPLMMMLGLDDIREFYKNSIEFLDRGGFV